MQQTTYIHRELEQELNAWIDSKYALVILGPRQVGKTTLLKYYANKIDAKYVTLDDPETLELFNNDIKTFVKLLVPPNKKIIIDEIQYSPNAGQHLKYLYDVEEIKILTAGSVSDDVKIKLSQYLVGRALFFTLLPFSFAEFLKATNQNAYTVYSQYKLNLHDFSNLQKLKTKLKLRKPSNTGPEKLIKASDVIPLSSSIYNQLTNDYLVLGGYPDVVLSPSRQNKVHILKNILNAVLTKDIASYFNYNNTQDIINTLRYLSGNLGSLLVINELSNYLKTDTRKVKKILDILMRTYIISISPAFSRNRVAEVKKAVKPYFIDTGVANYFKMAKEELGTLVENYIFTVLYRLTGELPKYWRSKNKAEVDFIYTTANKKLVAVEVKAGSKRNLGKARFSFIRKYSPHYLLLLNQDYIGISQYRNTQIIFWPYWLV